MHQSLHIDNSLKFHISNFMYIGPLLMGIGTFLAIVACVIVLETRDKVLDMMEAQQWKSNKNKADFYKLICLELRNKELGEYNGESKVFLTSDTHTALAENFYGLRNCETACHGQ